MGQSRRTTGIGTSTRLDTAFQCGPALPARLSVNAFVRSSDKANGGCYVTRWLDSAVSGTHYISSGVTAFQLAESVNFDARKAILFLSDSIWNGTGPSDVNTCIAWLINRF